MHVKNKNKDKEGIYSKIIINFFQDVSFFVIFHFPPFVIQTTNKNKK